MTLNRYGYWLLLIFLLPFCMVKAQVFPEKNYPKGYFRWPVGAQVAIAANFGELRPNHYHMGLDCKTEKKQNMPIYAAAEGYIAKVKIEPYGFGRAIYVNHPNGLTTLYAHLNDVYPELEEYIKKEQYRLKTWRAVIDLPADALPVTKGQFIAYSGNTGGSQGPHLHFEIRDTKTDKVLNPLLFGFPIADNTPPDILRLAVYDRCKSVFEQSPRLFTLKKVNGVYVPSPALILANTDKVSFAITAYDRSNGSGNQNGIYQGLLYHNEQVVVGFELDSIGYDETRYLNAHIDYRLKGSGGPYVQHLSRLPGYTTTAPYKEFSGNGVINIEDDSIHQLRIVVADANGNKSTLQFAVRRGPQAPERPAGADTMALYNQRIFHPGYINVFENSTLRFHLPENALYDSVRFTYRELQGGNGTVYQLLQGTIPVHPYFPISIKASTPMPNKMVMHRYWGAKHDYARAEPLADNWYRATFREFGYFELLLDTTPPSITPVGFKNEMNCAKSKRLAFVIIDNTEELVNFTATLDGEWLRFSNDKGKTFVYEFDERCGPGRHELKISVEDCVGNRSERVYYFTR